jgi:hypothetical protein
MVSALLRAKSPIVINRIVVRTVLRQDIAKILAEMRAEHQL